MRYNREVSNVKYLQDNCGMICKKIELLKELSFLVKALNKIDNEPVDYIFGFCNEFIRKLTYYLFKILDKEALSLGDRNFFTALKENATLIKKFGPMYSDFL